MKEIIYKINKEKGYNYSIDENGHVIKEPIETRFLKRLFKWNKGDWYSIASTVIILLLFFSLYFKDLSINDTLKQVPTVCKKYNEYVSLGHNFEEINTTKFRLYLANSSKENG